MKFSFYFLLFLSLASYDKAVAQRVQDNAAPVPNLIPPSPDAASLGKYGEIPVEKYNGLPNIDIPLYTVKSGDITVPVSVSYHAAGIRVEERASWTGLGWSLNAGGMITRTTVGIPDEGDLNRVGYLNNPYDLENLASLPVDTQTLIAKRQQLGQLDTEPDIFFFNFCGISGKFIINKTTHTVNIVPKRNLLITFTDNLSSWTITDEKGYKYTFSGTERSLTGLNAHGGTKTNVTTGWYLKTITSPTNHLVTFNYQPYLTTLNSLRSTQRKIFIGGDTRNCPLNSTDYSEFFTSTDVNGQRIASIVFDNGTVTFTKTSTNRQDIANDYALDSVRVFDNSSNLIKSYKFNYGYYSESVGLSGSQVVQDGETLKRLQLTGIDELSTKPNVIHDKRSYTFTYNGNVLPYIFSYSQDHWGYYNGAQNSMMVPNYNNINYGGANKVANPAYASFGILKRITYPTGGTTDFNFEMNQALVSADNYNQFFNPTDFSNPPNIPTVQYSITIDNNKRIDTLVVDSSGYPNKVSQFSYNIVFPQALNCDGRDRDCLGSFSVSLEKISGINPDKNIGGQLTSHLVVNGQIRDTIYLTPGAKYVFRMDGINTSVQGVTATITGTKPVYQSREGTKFLNLGVGGLRIASIVNDPLFGKRDTTLYRYVDSLNYTTGNAYYSTGRIISYPKYDHLIQNASGDVNGDGSTTIYTCTADVITSNSSAPLANYSGETVSYKLVQETHLSGNKQLKSVEEFFSSDDYPDHVNYTYPYVITESFPYKRGLLKRTSDYSFKNNAYILIKENLNQYTLQPDSYSYVPGLAIGSNSTTSIGGTTTSNYIYKNYKISTEWVFMSQAIQTQYDLNGLHPVTDTTIYFYDNPVHLQLTRTQRKKSDGKMLTSVSTYVDDYASGTTFIDDMKSHHQVGLPIEQVTYQTDSLGNRIIAGQATAYKSGGTGLADKVYKLELGPPLSLSAFKFSDRSLGQLPYGSSPAGFTLDGKYALKLSYDKYDTAGNLLMFTSQGKAPGSFQWAYNNTYPVVKAANASYNNIFYDGFEDGDGNSPAGDAKTGHYSHTGSYNKVLTGLDSGKYILSYWQKSNGTWALQFGTVTITNGTYTITLSTQIDDIKFYPSSALMTTYTYDPLVGMTSSTDPKGEVTYYEYDSFQRLMNIKDKDSNIIKYIDYHYQNQ